VRSVTITRLERVRDLDQLAQLVTLVEDDIAGDD
jgi:hypothetical protein